MFKIITPATTANIGPGFDFLGLALDLHNEILFDKSDVDIEQGFENVGENLVLKTYKYIMEKYNDKYIPIKLVLSKNEIPASHGLGSSASAIVSGMMIANFFLTNKLDEKTLIDEMVKYEGHPDNILPCFYGKMVSSITSNGNLNIFKHNVSSKLIFNVIIPSYNVSTKSAREILPSSYTLEDVTFNASRAFMLKKALEDGDIELINLASKDLIHEPYRKKLIKEWDKINSIASSCNATLNISGSGPTMISISYDDLFYKKASLIDSLIIKMLHVEKKGARII